MIRFRAPPGSEYEFTRKLAIKMLEVIDQETKHKVAISMGYVGMAATNTATNNMLLFMRGPDDGQIRVRLLEGSGLHVADLRERLRRRCPSSWSPGRRRNCSGKATRPRKHSPWPGRFPSVSSRATSSAR